MRSSSLCRASPETVSLPVPTAPFTVNTGRSARRGRLLPALCLLVLGLVPHGGRAFAAPVNGRMQLADSLDRKSQAIIDEMNRLLAEDGINRHWTCAMGEAPAWVSARRARYGSREPFADASEMCVATLGARARGGQLDSFYRDLLTKLGGDAAHAATWPRVIGTAVLGDKTRVDIGNRKVIEITPALAFDAGFTVAYMDGEAGQAAEADATQLKTLAEACLSQRGDAGTCFSAGYVYGGRAFRTPASATP